MTPEQKKNLNNIRFALMNQCKHVYIQFAETNAFARFLPALTLQDLSNLKQYYDFVISNGIADETANDLDKAKMVDDELVRRQSIRISSMFNINPN